MRDVICPGCKEKYTSDENNLLHVFGIFEECQKCMNKRANEAKIKKFRKKRYDED